MWFSAIGHQNISPGDQVDISVGTSLPDGSEISAGILFADNRIENKSVAFCQWRDQYGVFEWADLQPAQWGDTYTFGLEYTSDSSILVWINGQVMYSFSVPGADVLYSQGGTKFWFQAWSVIGDNNVTAEIDWAEALGKCDFSTSSDIKMQRCFGGMGSQCEGDAFLYFYKDENTCLVQGWMSVGSILHDRCCFENDNKGFMCDGISTLFKRKCFREFYDAKSDLQCGHFWSYSFGPYPAGNTGDDTSQDLRAPSGARIHPQDQSFCQSGQCRVDAKGKTIINGKGFCRYCICQ
jgi:hypothetical protein